MYATSRRALSALSSAARGTQIYDACIVGGGVVGLAVAREMATRGHSVILVEKEQSVGAGAASAGNSGLVHTGYDANPESLEAKLLRRSLAIRPALMDAIGLDEHEHWRQAPGSLVVAWSPEEKAKLQGVLDETRASGDADTRLVEPSELFELEPGLSRDALGAVLCPHETVAEPWLFCTALAESARLHSAVLRVGTELVGAALSRDDGLWTLRTRPVPPQPWAASHCAGRSASGERLVPPPPPVADVTAEADTDNGAIPLALARWVRGHAAAVEAAMPEDEFSARAMINCAGLYGDLIEQMRMEATAGCDGKSGGGKSGGGKSGETDLVPPFSVTPRKGQFAVFRPAQPSDAPRLVIEPIAGEFTKGVIVWSSLHGNILVGPTATPQPESRTDRSTDDETLDALIAHGERVLPALRQATLLGSFSGLRPATEHRDYQIWTDAHERWVSVGGIRSTGLSASPAIGEYVSELVEAVLAADGDDTRYVPPAHAAQEEVNGELPGVSEAVRARQPLRCGARATPSPRAPTLEALRRSYRSSDGCVPLFGRLQRVVHPITSFGCEK